MTSLMIGSLSAELISFFREGQHYFNDTVFSELDAIKQGHALAAYFGLALAGFVYGAVHAIGPGHGKAVVCSYIFANENSLKRGLLITALSSILQAIVAIALVLGFYYILAQTRAEAESAAALLEKGSYVLIGCLGAWLVAQGLFALKQAFFPHEHHHAHEHDEQCSCCSHAPNPEIIAKKKDAASMAAMIVSIGIRPCTGALLLLFFSCMFDLAWPGVLATLAMSLGTALTTGMLAILAVKSKDLALSLVSASERRAIVTRAAFRLVCGSLILAIAGLFLITQTGGENQAAVAHPLYKALK